jgi:hypothetical protein
MMDEEGLAKAAVTGYLRPLAVSSSRISPSGLVGRLLAPWRRDTGTSSELEASGTRFVVRRPRAGRTSSAGVEMRRNGGRGRPLPSSRLWRGFRQRFSGGHSAVALLARGSRDEARLGVFSSPLVQCLLPNKHDAAPANTPHTIRRRWSTIDQQIGVVAAAQWGVRRRTLDATLCRHIWRCRMLVAHRETRTDKGERRTAYRVAYCLLVPCLHEPRCRSAATFATVCPPVRAQHLH